MINTNCESYYKCVHFLMTGKCDGCGNCEKKNVPDEHRQAFKEMLKVCCAEHGWTYCIREDTDNPDVIQILIEKLIGKHLSFVIDWTLVADPMLDILNKIIKYAENESHWQSVGCGSKSVTLREVLDFARANHYQNLMDLWPNNRVYIRAARGNGKSFAIYNFLKEVMERSVGPFTYFPEIEKVLFNDPATIVFWKDGKKTIVKAENETYDPEKGLAMAISKRALGNCYEYYNVFKHWLKKAPMKNSANPMEQAYVRLVGVMNNKKATRTELTAAIEESIGYLGEALD